MENSIDYGKLLSILPDMVCIAGTDGYFRYVNPEWEKVLGHTLEDLLSRPLFDFIHPADHEPTQREIERQMNGAATLNFQNRYRCKDGSYKVLEWRSTPAEGDKLFAVARDITERKQTEEALRNNETRYRSLFESVADAVMLFDGASYSFLDINEAALKLYGYTREEFLGLAHTDITAEPAASMASIQTIKPGQGIYIKERLHRKKDGTLFPVEIMGSAMELDGRLHICGVVRDITGRKRVEARLRDKEARLQTIIDKAPVMIDSFDSSGKCLLWNEECARQLGWGIDEINVADNPMALFYPDRCVRRQVLTAIKKADGIFREFTVKAKNGSNRCQVWANFRLPDGITISFGLDITDRKRAEEALKYERDFIERVMKTSPAGIVRVDAGGRIVYINRRAEEILGFRVGGSEMRRYNHPDWNIEGIDGGHFPDESLPFSIVQKTGESVFDIRHAIVRSGGEKRFLSINAAPLSTPSGAFEGMVATIDDITHRIDADKALRRSEERFSSMFEHMGSGVAIYEPVDNGDDFVFKAFNSAAEKISRMGREQVLGCRLLALLPDMEKSGLPEALRRVWRTGQSEHMAPFYYNDGIREGWRENRIYKLPSGEIVALFDDVTERKQYETALIKSEEKFRVMMESMRDAAYIVSSDFHIEYMNPKMMDRIGRDAVGERCHEALYKKRARCDWCILHRVMKGEHVEYEISDPTDGRYYAIANSPVRFSNGVVSKLTIFRNITEKKALESQLRHVRKMESIGTLAGGIAHDFNNILYAILGNSELALDHAQEGSRQEFYLNQIHTAGRRAAEIVRQLLNFSRRTDQHMQPMDALSVVRDAVKMVRTTIPAAIEIRQRLPESEAMIFGDPIQINQALTNICINASQVMEKTGGSIDIHAKEEFKSGLSVGAPSVYHEGKYLKITIRDTGPGIAPDIMDRIFDPYFTTKEVGKGSGLGLAVVHGIVKSHGGAIAVENRPSQGAAFILYFPLLKEPAPIQGNESAKTKLSIP